MDRIVGWFDREADASSAVAEVEARGLEAAMRRILDASWRGLVAGAAGDGPHAEEHDPVIRPGDGFREGIGDLIVVVDLPEGSEAAGEVEDLLRSLGAGRVELSEGTDPDVRPR